MPSVEEAGEKMIDIVACIEIEPKGKARPRVTKNGTFMPDDYRAWKHRLGMLMLAHRGKAELPIKGPVRIGTIFYTPSGSCRSDLDNSHAAVLDALQDAGWILNDRQVKAGVYAIERRPTPMLSIRIQSIPNP